MENEKKESPKPNSEGKPQNMPAGADKAAARAKRKESKKQNKGAKKDVPKQNEIKTTNVPQPVTKPKSIIEVESVVKVEKNNGVIINNVEQKTSDAKVPAQDGPSKAELRSQRKALQEAQRLAKAAAKLSEKSSADIVKIVSDSSKKIDSNKNDTQPIKTPCENSENQESKADLRAKRRAIQEAQRQKKIETQAGVKAKVFNEKNKTSFEKSKEPIKTVFEKTKEPLKVGRMSTRKDSISVVTGGNFQKQVQLFNHLYLHHSTSLTKELTAVVGLHAAIIRLGAQYMSHNILGSNARCLALLSAIKHLVTDYRTPPQQEFCRSLEANLQSSTNYLQKCRPLAVSMTNAVRNIKWQLTQMDTNRSDKENKAILLDGIDTYINEEIGMADKAISLTVQAKIYNRDVILTYGCSSIVMKILVDAHKNGKVFKVIVVDARPLLEGRELLRKLVNAGLNCSYVLINAASFIMGRVTKVLLGAHSLLANGYVMSRAGTAQVALVAQSFNKPVLVCCETYKFCERVQTDSIVHNEIGDPDKLFATNTFEGKSPLANWKESRFVTPLNLMYDITPPHLVSAVVTELAILPCTSVPVILRIKPTELAL
ncbi:eukaryotic translation initiation factor 2B subunit delta [Carabus blaptoides fortunei]